MADLTEVLDEAARAQTRSRLDWEWLEPPQRLRPSALRSKPCWSAYVRERLHFMCIVRCTVGHSRVSASSRFINPRQTCVRAACSAADSDGSRLASPTFNRASHAPVPVGVGKLLLVRLFEHGEFALFECSAQNALARVLQLFWKRLGGQHDSLSHHAG